LRLLFVGRLHRDKGVFDLPLIDRALDDRGIAVTWTVIGTGPDEPALRDAWTGAHVSFLRRRAHEEVLAIAADHDAFVLPSRFEGFPLALLEAMGAGVVPVATRLESGVAESITDGTTGFLREAGDIAGFADAIAALDRDRARLASMADSARRHVAAHHDMRTCTDAYQALFRATASCDVPVRPMSSCRTARGSIGAGSRTSPCGRSRLIRRAQGEWSDAGRAAGLGADDGVQPRALHRRRHRKRARTDVHRLRASRRRRLLHDSTVAIARRYESDPRVRVIVNERIAATIQTGITPSRSPGTLLQVHDSDDVMYPHCLAVMVRALDMIPEAGLALSAHHAWSGAPTPIASTPRLSYCREFLGFGMFSQGPSNALFRTDVFRALGGFPEVGRTRNLAFWLHACRTTTVALAAADLYWYRVHEGQHLRTAESAFDLAARRRFRGRR